MDNTRNFSIIAHIDHGKSTLADRMLELTGTVEKRKMKEQVLDSMDLERERGITIKMQPVRIEYKNHTFNLIDTPGHIDFSYEVSRALRAVEGAILLVDATQGVQAQTLSTLHIALEVGVKILPVVSKVDSSSARIDEVKKELAELLRVDKGEILEVSGKTGLGVEKLLDRIISEIPGPESGGDETKALVFDYSYSDHRGIIVYLRMFGGYLERGKKLRFFGSGSSFKSLEVGVFSPEMKSSAKLSDGTIGYVVTGIKEPGMAFVGDTIVDEGSGVKPMPGYKTPTPVVWASVYPESQDDLSALKQALDRMRLSDASLSFEEEASAVLGRGFRCGFLGMLHLEIVTERLKREFDLSLILTTPSVAFRVIKDGNQDTVYSPTLFPDDGSVDNVEEPWVAGEIIMRPSDIGPVSKLLYSHEAIVGRSESFGSIRTKLHFEMPLRELYRNFFDELKRISSGYASLFYDLTSWKPADVTRLDILIAGEEVPALSRVVSSRRINDEAKRLVEKLHKLLPKQLFVTKIQARARGRIVSSKTLSAARKDVTAHLYGGDVTRKKKLLEKQKKGKKKMKERGKVRIPQETFLKLLRPD